MRLLFRRLANAYRALLGRPLNNRPIGRPGPARDLPPPPDERASGVVVSTNPLVVPPEPKHIPRKKETRAWQHPGAPRVRKS